MRHINFCVKLYHRQRVRGRYYLHEHPQTATSWKLPAMQALMERDDNHVAVGHMCAFGMTTTDPEHGVLPAKKPTKFVTNSAEVAKALSRTCKCECVAGKPKHGLLMGGRAAAAAIYPDDLCNTVCEAIKHQVALDRARQVETRSMNGAQMLSFILTLQKDEKRLKKGHWIDVFHEEDGEDANSVGKVAGGVGKAELRKCLDTKYRGAQSEVGWDDPNDCPLDAGLIRKARQIEIDYFRKQGVYIKVPRSEALWNKAKII